MSTLRDMTITLAIISACWIVVCAAWVMVLKVYQEVIEMAWHVRIPGQSRLKSFDGPNAEHDAKHWARRYNDAACGRCQHPDSDPWSDEYAERVEPPEDCDPVTMWTDHGGEG